MKALKWTLIIVFGLGILGFLGFQFMIYQTKKASPEATVVYEGEDITLSVNYCRPYKKGRKIFGELVPYGEVWRTGANEPTTFMTNKDITIEGVKLKAGKYTLWTIPQETQWTIILNSKMYDWGVNWDEKASRDPMYDVLRVNVPSVPTKEVVEQFTIEFIYHVNMVMKWDDTEVIVPILTY
ncbi:MAG: hypothetical protein CMP59_04720 [Flavobacteriales bacterium]|nr:hypothetical protein [Flavobacteriales bacterium]|tara:strand:- start:269 stop:814 length:546 start_codon:yes stop_codon:yes gene_type:complete